MTVFLKYSVTLAKYELITVNGFQFTFGCHSTSDTLMCLLSPLHNCSCMLRKLYNGDYKILIWCVINVIIFFKTLIIELDSLRNMLL